MKKSAFKIYVLVLVIVFSVISLNASHKVFVLHGYASTTTFMRKIVRDIKRANFDCENYAYPGLYTSLDSLGIQLYTDVLEDNLDTVSFVTHSMGGLVVRSMLKHSGLDNNFPNIYRIVMISPPNQGADIADLFSTHRYVETVMGPNIAYMRTDSSSYANRLPIPYDIELGILIGIRGKHKGFNPFIKGDNDGLIKPEHTLLGNEKDVALLNYTHATITQRRKPRKLIIEFLQFGYFVSKKEYCIKIE